MSGGGTNTSTTQSGPPAQYLQQYANVNQQAQTAAATPYQPYTGNLQAGLSPDQQQAIQTIQGTQGIANPFINAAAQEYGNSTQDLSQGFAPYATNATDFDYQAGGTADNIYNSTQPGINQADQLYNQSAKQLTPTQFSAGQVSQYESPYTQQVVNATQAEFNNQNQQQQQAVKGNAISQGAFGGDRADVAAGITAGQQQLAQAPVIAGLENQGYSQALNEFNTQQQVGLGAQQASQQLQQGAGAGILSGNQQGLSAMQAAGQLQLGAGQGIASVGGQALGANEANAWLSSQAGQGLAALGNEALNTNLTQAGAQLGVGNLEQQQAQTALNIPYEQYQAAQAYPFQTSGWLANIAEGLGGASGGQSSTTTPGPSTGSQLAGGALTSAALIGATGGYGSNGWLSNLFSGSGGSGIEDGAMAARGGAIPHRAPGGGLPNAPVGALNIPTGVPDISMSVIPGASGMGAASSGRGSFNLNTSTGSTTSTSGGDSTLGGLLKGAGTIAAGIYGGPAGAMAASALGSQVHFAPGGGIIAFPQHRARPGMGRGLPLANDNGPTMPERRFASGGANVVIPQLPTSGGGITGSVKIPQLSGGAGHAIVSGGGMGGLGGVSDYLSNTAATAYHPPPPPAAPAPVSGPAAPAPGAAPPPGIPTLSPAQITQLQQNLEQQQYSLEQQNVGQAMGQNANGGARGGAIGRGGLGRAAGGIVPRGFDAGGSPDDSDMPLPEPPLPPDLSPAPSTGAGLPDAGGPTMAPPDAAPSALTPSQAHPPPDATPVQHSPWQALLNAGLAIMGGTSPHAMVNIGRGGQAAMQFNEQQRAREEQQSLARMSQQETERYHSGELDVHGQQIQQTGSLAKAQMDQTLALKQAEMAQQMQLQKMQIGMEGARLAEERRFHDVSMTPPELRIFSAYSKMSPDDQAKFSSLNMAQKGIPDVMGSAAGVPPMLSQPDSAPSGTPTPPLPPAQTDGAAAATPVGTSASAAPAAAPAPAPSPSDRNEAFLAKLNPAYQPVVKAMAEGRMQIPSRPSPLQQQLIAAVGQYDPTFDTTDYNKRASTAKSFAPSGSDGKNITAINTAMAHMSSLYDNFGALQNGQLPVVNWLKNTVADATGSASPNNAKVVRDSVASEMRKVFANAGGGSLEELRNWESNFPLNGSPAQMKGALDHAVELMDGRLTTLAQQYSNGMGTNRNGVDLLSPEARTAYTKLTNRQPVSAAPRPPVYGRGSPAGTSGTGGGQQPLEAGVSAMPKAGDVQDGYRYLGGDPASPRSWQKQ